MKRQQVGKVVMPLVYGLAGLILVVGLSVIEIKVVAYSLLDMALSEL